MGVTREQREERERLAKSGLKKCSKCKEVSSINRFCKDSSKSDGKSSICKRCQSEKKKKWYSNNTEYAKKTSRELYHSQPDRFRELKVSLKQREPLWQRLRDGRNRAKAAGNQYENIRSEALLQYWESAGLSIEICHYCNNHIELDELEIDHGQPIERGGGHVLENLYPSHKKCNREKNNKTIEEYNQYLMQAV